MRPRYVLEGVCLVNPNRHFILLYQFPQFSSVVLPFLFGVDVVEESGSDDLGIFEAQSPAYQKSAMCSCLSIFQAIYSAGDQ